MSASKILEDLNLIIYEFSEMDNSFKHHEELNGEKVNPYDFSAETIKLVRYLEEHHINFEEDLKGDIKLVA